MSMKRKRSIAESIEEKVDNDLFDKEPPTKKKKYNKPKKAKSAKPYQCRAAGYQIGTFSSLKTISMPSPCIWLARSEFKALFGMNRLTVAWSDVKSSQIQDAFAMERAGDLMNNMKTERVEINIDNIDSIQLTECGAVIKLIIITNYPPIFTKQMSSLPGKGSKFTKTEDPTNGNALKYKKHIIHLDKRPTLKNIGIVESKLKNGSAKLKQLFEDKVCEQYQEITMHDMYDLNILRDVKKERKNVKRTRKKKKKTDTECDENTNNKKKQRKKKRKKKTADSDNNDSAEDWVP